MTDDIMYILIFMFKQKRRKKPVHILTVRQFRQAIRVCFFKLSENESLRFNIWDFRKQPFHSVHSKPDHQSVLHLRNLSFYHGSKDTILLQQFVKGAAFRHAPLIQHDDAVCIANRG